MIVGAHALDAEVMAGGIAALAQTKGIPVTLLHMTRGERGNPAKSGEIFGAQLEKEMAEAARVLGVRQLWPGFMAPLEESDDGIDWIENLILKEGITHVLTHWVGSWHPSHIRTHRMVVKVVDKIKKDRPALFFAQNGEDLTGFKAEWYVPIDSVYERWMQAVNCYELFRMSLPGSTGGNSIPYYEYYSSTTRMNGFYADAKHSQALMRGHGSLPEDLGARERLLPV